MLCTPSDPAHSCSQRPLCFCFACCAWHMPYLSLPAPDIALVTASTGLPWDLNFTPETDRVLFAWNDDSDPYFSSPCAGCSTIPSSLPHPPNSTEHFFFKFKIYFHLHKRVTERDISHLLVHSPNTHNSWELCLAKARSQEFHRSLPHAS